MANTKRLDPAERKARKRDARRQLKALYAGMTREEKSKYEQAKENKPNTGLKRFLTDLRKPAEAKS